MAQFRTIQLFFEKISISEIKRNKLDTRKKVKSAARSVTVRLAPNAGNNWNAKISISDIPIIDLVQRPLPVLIFQQFRILDMPSELAVEC